MDTIIPEPIDPQPESTSKDLSPAPDPTGGVKVEVKPKTDPQYQVVKATDIKNPWVCQHCGAIMGSVYHEKIRAGLTVTSLILFRGATKIGETMPASFIFGKVYAGEVTCARCGMGRKWIASPETLKYLSEGSRHKPKKRNPNL